MRVIKFRAWTPGSPGKKGYMTPHEEIGFWCNFPEVASRDNNYLMQFTGLLDKTGKEIFEGDIVKMPGQWFHGKIGSDGRRMSEPPEWVNEEVRAPIGQHLFAAGDWSVEPEVCEVVGNVWENGNLLR